MTLGGIASIHRIGTVYQGRVVALLRCFKVGFWICLIRLIDKYDQST